MSDTPGMRGVDAGRTDLTAIGAEQEAEPDSRGHGDDLAAPAPYDVWEHAPTADGRRVHEGAVTYYDRPAMKEPVWIWSVPAYFFVGGAAGAAALLGAGAQYDGDLGGLTRTCRRIAAAGTTVGTGLLVIDLGRPERFLNMLRVIRPTSPMSVGSWILASTSGASVAAAVLGEKEGLLGRFGRLSGAASGVMGMPLAGYTAVLIANTAVPAWQGARRTLPILFMASSLGGAAGLLGLTRLNDREALVVQGLAISGAVGELVGGAAVERSVGRVERVGAPYETGRSGRLWKAAKVASVASLVGALFGRRRRWVRVLSGLFGVLGSLAMRFAVFEAGKASSRDPRATFAQQRAGHAGKAATGTAAITGPEGRRAR